MTTITYDYNYIDLLLRLASKTQWKANDKGVQDLRRKLLEIELKMPARGGWGR